MEAKGAKLDADGGIFTKDAAVRGDVEIGGEPTSVSLAEVEFAPEEDAESDDAGADFSTRD